MIRAVSKSDLAELIASRDGLEQLARMAPDALGIDSAEDFLVALAHRLPEIAPFVNDVALVERDGGSRLAWSRILAGTGRFEDEIGRPIFDLVGDEAAEALGRALFDDEPHEGGSHPHRLVAQARSLPRAAPGRQAPSGFACLSYRRRRLAARARRCAAKPPPER